MQHWFLVVVMVQYIHTSICYHNTYTKYPHDNLICPSPGMLYNILYIYICAIFDSCPCQQRGLFYEEVLWFCFTPLVSHQARFPACVYNEKNLHTCTCYFGICMSLPKSLYVYIIYGALNLWQSLAEVPQEGKQKTASQQWDTHINGTCQK